MKSLIIKNDEIDYELFEKIASFLDKYDENEVLLYGFLQEEVFAV